MNRGKLETVGAVLELALVRPDALTTIERNAVPCHGGGELKRSVMCQGSTD